MPTDNIVEAHITWVSRGSKEQFTKEGTATKHVPFFPPNPVERDGSKDKENLWHGEVAQSAIRLP